MTARQAGAAGSSPVQRVRQAHVEWVRDRLSDRDWEIIRTVDQLRLVTSAHLERLHFLDLSPSVRGRVRRRVLNRLVGWRVLLTLDRRIGGVRAGSSGLVLALDSAGQQLGRELAATNGSTAVRRPREPSVVLLAHALAASELYVSLVELSQAQGFTVAGYHTEPACWWPNSVGGWLKPDAYLKLSAAKFDDHWWVEIDKGTEHLPVIRRKLLTYLDYANGGGLGPGDVLPRVLVTAPDERRREQVQGVIAALPEPAAKLLHVVTEVRAADFLYEVLRE
jgi:hypothetical protein